MIEVKRDHNLRLPEIRVPITHEGTNSGVYGEVDTGRRQQSKEDGILAPLVRLNNQTIMSSQIESIRLTCSPVPMLDIVIHDALNIIKSISSPSSDNNIQLQIIPPIDNTYRKINLLFYITSSVISGSTVYITGTYYAPRLYDSVMKAYGKISTYELFDSISSEYSLGFNSNVAETSDTRWIYNPNSSVIDLMSQQIAFSSISNNIDAEQSMHVFDWWIGWYNDINLVDVYKEYREVVPDEKMQVWSSMSIAKANTDEQATTEKMLKMFTNIPSMMNNQQYISDYTPITTLPEATDLNYETFYMDTIERVSTVVMDGDVKNNILMKYQYGGEVFGDYDYLTRQACRDLLMSKISNQIIEVTLRSPMFGFMRGEKVNIYWYDINNPYSQDLQDVGNQSISSNIPLPDSIKFQDVKLIINKTISGQYYIVDTELKYDSGMWSHVFRLGRYADHVSEID